MALIYYHNPRCSKSLEGLELLQSKGIDVQVREYLKEPPTIDELSSIHKKLNVPIDEMIRKGESVWKDLGLNEKNLADRELFEVIFDNPVLLQRPILVVNEKAVIGRPSQKLIEIIK